MAFVLEKPERLDLVKAVKLLDEMDGLILRASACGLDCEAQDLMAQALRQRVDALRQNFLNVRKE